MTMSSILGGHLWYKVVYIGRNDALRVFRLVTSKGIRCSDTLTLAVIGRCVYTKLFIRGKPRVIYRELILFLE